MQTEYLKLLPESFRVWLDGRKIEEVECVLADMAGVSRGKAMPSNKFSRQEQMFMPLSIFYQTIAGDYVDMKIRDDRGIVDIFSKPLDEQYYKDWASNIHTHLDECYSLVTSLKEKGKTVLPRFREL